MNLPHNKSVSLLELLIAVSILGLLVVGIYNINLFSHYQVRASDIRAKLQNDTAYVLERMAKEIVRAIGNERVNGVDSVAIRETTGNSETIIVYIDGNGDGQRQPDINNPTATDDHWIAYRFDSGGAPSNRNQIRYCGLCRNSNCNFNQCTPNNGEVLISRATQFVPIKPVINPGVDNTLRDNYVDVQLTTRDEPTEAVSSDNPQITVKTRIFMPAVSVN